MKTSKIFSKDFVLHFLFLIFVGIFLVISIFLLSKISQLSDTLKTVFEKKKILIENQKTILGTLASGEGRVDFKIKTFQK